MLETPPLLLRLHAIPEMAIQFPVEIAHSLLRRRHAVPVAAFAAQPDLVLNDDDLEGIDLSDSTLMALVN